jgi:class 3 adenylate cyclase
MSRQSKIRDLASLYEFIVSDRADLFILFADLCGSTQFKLDCISQGLPELTWIGRQLLFLQRVTDLIKKHQGIVVKTVGDEVVAFFRPPTSAEGVLKCAIEIIQSLENYLPFQGNSQIETKISIDFGKTYNGTVMEKMVPYDPIGLPVDRCARINSITGKNEITFSQDFLTTMTTDATEAQLKAKYGFETRQEDLKGIGLIIIHRMPAIVLVPPNTSSI